MFSYYVHSTMEIYGPSRSNAQSNNPILMGQLALPAQQTAFVSAFWGFKTGHWKAVVIWVHSAQPPDLSVLWMHNDRHTSHNGATCLPTYSSTQACVLTFSTHITGVEITCFATITKYNHK